MAVIGWVDPDMCIPGTGAVVEGNWLFLKPIYSFSWHAIFLSLILKFRMSLTLKSGRPPSPSQPGTPARVRNNTFAFFPPTVLTPRHTDTQWAIARGSGDTDTDHPWLSSPRSGSLLVSPPEQHLTGVAASSWQHHISIRCHGPCLVNSQLTHARWPWVHLEMVPDLRDIPECLPAYKREHSLVVNENHLGSRETWRAVITHQSASVKENKNPVIMNLNWPVYIKCFNYTLDNGWG